jgi:hypothetical protein
VTLIAIGEASPAFRAAPKGGKVLGGIPHGDRV